MRQGLRTARGKATYRSPSGYTVKAKSNNPFGSIGEKLDRAGATVFVHPKHPGSICIINYKGGVGKTTVTALLGIYLGVPIAGGLLWNAFHNCPYGKRNVMES